MHKTYKVVRYINWGEIHNDIYLASAVMIDNITNSTSLSKDFLLAYFNSEELGFDYLNFLGNSDFISKSTKIYFAVSDIDYFGGTVFREKNPKDDVQSMNIYKSDSKITDTENFKNFIKQSNVKIVAIKDALPLKTLLTTGLKIKNADYSGYINPGMLPEIDFGDVMMSTLNLDGELSWILTELDNNESVVVGQAIDLDFIRGLNSAYIYVWLSVDYISAVTSEHILGDR